MFTDSDIIRYEQSFISRSEIGDVGSIPQSKVLSRGGLQSKARRRRAMLVETDVTTRDSGASERRDIVCNVD